MEKKLKNFKILTINKVRFETKWVEFWFEEDFPRMSHEKSYHLSTKSYILLDAINKAKIYDDVLTNGLKGKKTVWEELEYNWELKEIL
jgi:hypothetical protein